MTTRQQRRAQARANAKRKHKPSGIGRAIRALPSTMKRLLKAATSLPWWMNVLGFCATLLVGYEVYYATIPEVNAPEIADVASPFAPPFRIHNPSHLISATDIVMRCEVDQILSKDGASMQGGSVTSDTISVIEPDGVANMRCPIGRVGDSEFDLVRIRPGDKITKAHVIIHLQYRTLGVLRHTVGTEFTWFNTPSGHFWVKGEVAKEQ